MLGLLRPSEIKHQATGAQNICGGRNTYTQVWAVFFCRNILCCVFVASVLWNTCCSRARGCRVVMFVRSKVGSLFMSLIRSSGIGWRTNRNYLFVELQPYVLNYQRVCFSFQHILRCFLSKISSYETENLKNPGQSTFIEDGCEIKTMVMHKLTGTTWPPPMPVWFQVVPLQCCTDRQVHVLQSAVCISQHRLVLPASAPWFPLKPQ